MSKDTIYRQAAIDLLKQMRKDGDMIPWEGKDVFARIRKLPSAQPEQIKCKDCIYFDKYSEGIEKYQWDGFCSDWARNTYENWYCSRAERRTDE